MQKHSVTYETLYKVVYPLKQVQGVLGKGKNKLLIWDRLDLVCEDMGIEWAGKK